MATYEFSTLQIKNGKVYEHDQPVDLKPDQLTGRATYYTEKGWELVTVDNGVWIFRKAVKPASRIGKPISF